MRALVVVDVQRDFLAGGALAARHTEGLIPKINSLFDRFELIVGTKDWHPPHHGSFAKVHNKSVGEVVDLNGLPQILWPTHCVQGSHGSEFGDGLNALQFAEVFLKGVDEGIDSYSSFFDNGWRRSTGLDLFLKERGVDEVYICGLTTEYCVLTTALDAVALGFKVYVITDAICPVELKGGDSDRALQHMKENGIHCLTSAQLPR